MRELSSMCRVANYKTPLGHLPWFKIMDKAAKETTLQSFFNHKFFYATKDGLSWKFVIALSSYGHIIHNSLTYLGLDMTT
jgi:hypothetical protein